MSEMVEAEVVVIGAGPAGSVAGSMLARRGRKVLCLEAGTFPRFQIGESLLPRCNDILEEAGLLEAVVARGYMPKRAALFRRDDQAERFCFAEVFPGQRTQTFQVPRGDFDQTLATEARRQGVDLRFSARVDAVELGEGGGVVRATDLDSSQPFEVKTRHVIDCSGYGRVLPKLLKLEKESVITPRVAIFNHVEGDRRPAGLEEGDIWACLHPRGAWIWIIPFSNGRTSVGVVAEPKLLAQFPGSDRDKLKALIAEDPNAGPRLSAAQFVLKTARLEAWSAAVDRLHGPGWVVTGNAGEFLDPIFSSGVTLAFESASRAAVLVDRELSGETVSWDREYTEVINRAVGVFKVFVRSWYRDELPRVLLRKSKGDMIKRAITAVLGGYVLDEKNPFVRDPEGTLAALLKLG